MIHDFSLEDIGRELTSRPTSTFATDIESNFKQINEKLTNTRILVVGGAGSIGSETVKLLTMYPLKHLTVVDTSENYLADLIRSIRSRSTPPLAKSIEVIPIDYTGPQMAKLLASQKEQYDYVLNFAALKHVRSEKDIFSLLQMFHVNITGQYDFKKLLDSTTGSTNYFSVSTDKASNPTSLMGASKRVMEDVVFDTPTSNIKVNTSTRFANVAFSNGSLPLSFVDRLVSNQPLVAPKDTRRYFVSLKESGQICLLSTVLGPDQCITVPKLDPAECLITMEHVAETFLKRVGYQPFFTDNEEEAKTEQQNLKLKKLWPVLVTPLDTAGEKPYEEFVAKGETVEDFNMQSIECVRHLKSKDLENLLNKLREFIQVKDNTVSFDDVASVVSEYLPTFTHHSSDKKLDDRM